MSSPRIASRAAFGWLPALLALPGAGCRDDPWRPGAVGPLKDVFEEPGAALTAARLDDDRIEIAPPGGALASEGVAKKAVESDAPRVLYLFYADGGPPPTTSVCPGIPPKYTCSFGGADGVEGCKRIVQTYLDRWYADFNLIFTLKRPTSGPYYTEVITSDSAWCGYPAGVGGVAPFARDCSDLGGNACYAFHCGASPRQCAVVIAQEHAHLVGLEHTNSNGDLMNPMVCASCDGFEDRDNSVNKPMCRSAQNSYQMMATRLGRWPGGPKPDPFTPTCTGPVVTIDQPADGATVGGQFAVIASARDDCAITNMHIKVSPSGLETDASSSPAEWQVADVTGPQTIEVTARNADDATATAVIKVLAPVAGGGASGLVDGEGVRGEDYACAIASGGGAVPGGAADLLALGLALAIALGRGRARRLVSGTSHGASRSAR